MTTPRVMSEAIRWAQGNVKSTPDAMRVIMIEIQRVD